MSDLRITVTEDRVKIHIDVSKGLVAFVFTTLAAAIGVAVVRLLVLLLV